ncbi:hypothetical protein D3C87_1257490 [compost metagenome]
MSYILNVFGLGVGIGREHQKTVARLLGQNAAVHHYRHTEITQKIGQGSVARGGARQRMFAAVVS